MHSLTQNQNETIESALAGMRTAYNQFKIAPCHFTGIPDDLSSLDYIPYELPMTDQFAAGSVAFSFAWGHVLVTSFGFSWATAEPSDGPRLFALQHEDPSVLVFPYIRLLETTQSSGNQDSPAESLWFDTIRYFEYRSYIPDGWHPVFDAIHCPEKLECPKSTTKACQRLVDIVPDFYAKMSTYPYSWARNKQWNKLSEYADQLATLQQLSDR